MGGEGMSCPNANTDSYRSVEGQGRRVSRKERSINGIRSLFMSVRVVAH